MQSGSTVKLGGSSPDFAWSQIMEKIVMLRQTKLSFVLSFVALLVIPTSTSLAQTSWDFSQWLPFVNSTQTSTYTAGNNLQSKDKIILYNGSSTVTTYAVIKTYIDGATEQTTGPITMPPNSKTSVSVTRTLNNASAGGTVWRPR